MPRLFLDNEDTVKILEDNGVHVNKLAENKQEPDVCLKCYDELGLVDDVEHESYKGQRLSCVVCGDALTIYDDGPVPF